MTQTTAAHESPAGQAAPSLFARIPGVFLSPRSTYAAVAARPRVLGVLVVSVAVIAGAQAWFISTDVGKSALLDQQVTTMESFGVDVTDQMYSRMEQNLAYAPYTQAGSILVFMPLFLAIMAGLVLMVFNAFLGGDATFKQVYAVFAHSTLIGALQTIFTIPISYAQGTMASATRLSIFFPMLEEMGFANYLLSAIDLFIIWSLVNTAIGIAVLYRRRTGPIATSLLGLYAVIAVIIAAIRAF